MTKLKNIFLIALAFFFMAFGVLGTGIFIAVILATIGSSERHLLMLFSLLIISLFCLTLSVTLLIKIYGSKKTDGKQHVLSIIYRTLFLAPCILACFMIPQPGGICLGNRILSPIMGPWSRFLPPNALKLTTCTYEYLSFSYGLSILMLIFIPLSFWIKHKVFRYISISIGLSSTLIWVGYGMLRILSDTA